jgi:hypothetical protein
MDKKASKGVRIFSYIEILMGMAGSVLFFYSVHWLLTRSFYFIKTNLEQVYTIGVDFDTLYQGIWYCLLTFPFPVILILGAYTLKLHRWARKGNIIFVPLLLAAILVFLYINFSAYEKTLKWKSFFITVIPLTVLAIFKVWFLTRHKIKQQFF